MINFSYQAITESGRNISGTVEADSVEMAENFLLCERLHPFRDQGNECKRIHGRSLIRTDQGEHE